MNNFKVKLVTLILLFVALIIVILFSIFGFGLSYLSEEEIKETRELKEDLIKSLKINDLATVYEKNDNIYYYTISSEQEKKLYALKLELDSGYKYKIVNQKTNLIKVDYSKPIDIIIYNDKYYYEAKIQLTNLPLINIVADTEITKSSTNSTIKYINSTVLDKEIKNNAKIHVRGASSTLFPKKSYKIEFYNKNFENEKNVSISNFYYGSDFILDAVYRDPSKIRNLLATDLWNVISDDFTNVDIYSEFVELFINNEYVGLYVLTEPINRKKLNLNKSSISDTSVIVKSGGWNTIENGTDIEDITDSSYLEYELKYPNDEELYSVSWKKFFSSISNYYDSEVENTYEVISSTWNLNNYIDMLIFNTFINNTDNKLIKNNYFYISDLNSNEVYIQPWDMEYSFGLKYDSLEEDLTSKDESNYTDVINFLTEDENLNKQIINRYWFLKKQVLNMDYINSLLDNYKDILIKGSALRDSNKWLEYDIEEEIEFIRVWINNKINFFDNYIKELGYEQ